MATRVEQRRAATPGRGSDGQTQRKKAIKLGVIVGLNVLFFLGLIIRRQLNNFLSVFTSWKGVIVLVLISLFIAFLPRLLKIVIKNDWLRFVIAIIPIAAVLWWAAAPFFIDRTAADTDVFATVGTTVTTVTSAPPTTQAPGTVPTGGTTAPGPTTTEAPPPTSAAPPAVRSGELRGLTGHRAKGTVRVGVAADGRGVVRFEDMDIQNGPDYRVYLVRDPDQVEPGNGSVDLGAMTANKGDLNVDIPPDVTANLSEYNGVLVWCRAFSIEIAIAGIA